uniref:Uncharacterized protein n=1 Tax=Canis lupus dingo TaxID=286419 RepID=A0A8C0QX31_CANLU
MIGTQITVSPLCGWNLGPEGQRREWAGLSFAFPLEGTREEDNDDGDDYENMAPPYKDLPPKPGKRTSQKPGEGMCDPVLAYPALGLSNNSSPSSPPPGKKTENPPLPYKSPKIKVSLSHSLKHQYWFLCPRPHSPTIPASQLSQKSRCPGCYQEERLVAYLCLLVVVSLLLGCTGLAVTLIKYQEVVEELRILTFQQMAWQENVHGGWVSR